MVRSDREVSMLNQTISSPTWTPNRWTDWRSGLSGRQAALVRRYVLLVVLLSTLGCIYLWQINVITDLRQETGKMHAQTEEIEGINVVLMQQLAEWESPSHIDQAARAAGWQRVGAPAYVQVDSVVEDPPSHIQQIASTQATR
jgi:hypothetical protein